MRECENRIVDITLTIDGLILKNQTVDEFVDGLEINSNYPIVYDITYEECE